MLVISSEFVKILKSNSYFTNLLFKATENMNTDKNRRRKSSVYDTTPPSVVASQSQFKNRRRSLQSRRNTRDKDFFVPDEVEEWVLPEYRSLFHHLFLREEDDSSTCSTSSNGGARRASTSAQSSSNLSSRNRKLSPTESTGSSASNDEDGPLCNLVKSFPSWLKKVFHISDNNQEEEQQQMDENERHAWLDEIPIEICDKLRHIHIYV